MNPITIATVQFENKSGDKEYNLKVIEAFCQKASKEGAKAVTFHECSITGYTFAHHLTKEELLAISELIPDGPSIARLKAIAENYQITILAGLFERDCKNDIYNTYVCVNEKGLVAKHSKLHPFINRALRPGNSYCVFDLLGWKCGILICYDNNIIENVRATHLLGADIIFMPHVTMCTPSSRPGAGFVDPFLWENRRMDPTSLRMEFDGLKGRAWLMKWLPARAYDNGIYVVFSNPIGMDEDQLKNGCSMILDPFGDIIAECRNLDDDMVIATVTPEKLTQAGGYRYKNARRPLLYSEILGAAHSSEQKVAWIPKTKKQS